MTLGHAGPGWFNTDIVAAAANHVIEALEKLLGLEVSATKSVVTASTEKHAIYIAARITSGKIKPHTRAKMLRAGTTSGRRRCVHTLRARLDGTKTKAKRVTRLRRFGVNTAAWARTAGVPGMLYSVDITMLKKQRSVIARASAAPGAGKNPTVTNWLHECEGSKVDPIFMAHEAPINMLATAWWETWLPHDILTQAHDDAMQNLETAGFRWNAAKGSFAATILTARRIGWRFHSASVLKTDLGEEIILTRDSPSYVKDQVTAAVKRFIAKEIDEDLPMLKSHGRGPISKGMRRALKHSKKLSSIHLLWDSSCASFLRSAACNGQWTNCRLHRAGLSPSNLCNLCNDAVGSLEHRHTCARTAVARGKCVEDEECTAFVNKLCDGAKHLLKTRALLAMPDTGNKAPNVEGTMEWEVRPDHGVIDAECTIYTDGSMIDGPSTTTGRVGYGFAALDAEGNVTAKAYGTPPQWINSVPGAEAWALFEALRNSVPGCRIRSDCESVVNRFKSGRKAATAKNVKLARLWRMIFDCCDCFEDPSKSIDLVWMPAHTSKSQIGTARKGDRTKLTAEDRKGNELADALAKKGARLHRVPRAARNKLEVAERVALRAALQLGITTKAANATEEVHFSEDGKSIIRLVRDSNGDPKAAAKKKAATEQEATAKPSPKKVKQASSLVKPKLAAKNGSRCRRTQKRSRRKAASYLLGEAQARAATAAATATTPEFLNREAAKLSETATASRVSFLGLGGDCSLQTDSASSEPCPEATKAKERRLFDYKRPQREGKIHPAAKRRKLNCDVSSLVGERRKDVGGGPVQ